MHVRDHGSGFDMRYADKLFEPFQRLHGPEQAGGNGLGLAIVRCVAERHGGRVWAQSEPGAGSLFRRTAGRAGFREPGMSQKDILLVEDNPDDVELTRIAFADANVANRLEVVGDGAQALDYLFARGEYAHRDPGDLPSIVLLDLNLPKVDGREVLQAIRANEKTRGLPVVVLTTSTEIGRAHV